MSMYRFTRLLGAAGAIDAATTAHRSVPLLRAGQAFSALGLLLAIARVVVGGTSGGAILLLIGIPALILGGLLLFFFALSAKLYGQIAVGAILLLLGGCFGLLMLGTGSSQPPAQLTERAQHPNSATSPPTSAPISLPTPNSQSVPPANKSDTTHNDASSRPHRIDEPKHPSTLVERVRQAQLGGRVFAGRDVYHEPTCPSVTSRMRDMLPSAARMAGLTPASDCHVP